MKKRFLVTILLMASAMVSAAAAADDSPPAAPVTDPGLVALRYQQVLAQPEFKNAAESDVNSQFRDRLSQFFLHLGTQIDDFKYASNIPGIASLFFTFIVLIILAGLLYLGIRLSRRQGKWKEEAPSELGPGTRLRPPESYDEEIRAAVARSDWHAAWLSSWRQFLSRIEQARLVESDRTRTNREYLSQLRAHSLPASSLSLLMGLVDAYDRFIYGREKISEGDWTAFRNQIRESALMLHLDQGTTGRSGRPA